MNELVFLEPNKVGSEPFTTSKVIAEYGQVKHHTVTRLIQKYESDLKEYGKVRFEIEPLAESKTNQTELIYRLNEQQATLLITYMKNTAPVREFKKRLVHQFYLMRDELNRKSHELTERKPIRQSLTDTIKVNTEDPWAYKNYTDLAYRLATGYSAAQYRKAHGLKKTANVVEHMTSNEIQAEADMENRINVLVELGMNYGQIKEALQGRFKCDAEGKRKGGTDETGNHW